MEIQEELTVGMATVAQRVHHELSLIARLAGPDFSGIGLIVWDCSTPIPVFQMRELQPATPHALAPHARLIELAKEGGPFHDGFHVLNNQLDLVTASVYFSPPASNCVRLPERSAFGGRYLAAAFGSCLPGIVCTGALSMNYGPFVFQQGRQV